MNRIYGDEVVYTFFSNFACCRLSISFLHYTYLQRHFKNMIEIDFLFLKVDRMCFQRKVRKKKDWKFNVPTRWNYVHFESDEISVRWVNWLGWNSRIMVEYLGNVLKTACDATYYASKLFLQLVRLALEWCT